MLKEDTKEEEKGGKESNAEEVEASAVVERKRTNVLVSIWGEDIYQEQYCEDSEKVHYNFRDV